nr:unnamed protein product [Callosobruchus analis]
MKKILKVQNLPVLCDLLCQPANSEASDHDGGSYVSAAPTMASEQFSLCWDNFHKNMSSGMNSLLESEDLVDVTLAVQGKCLKAHKMVLSVCSPYFKELFKSNPCQHPIVFMKDVSYEALSDLLQFMYQGEVQVSQENLTTFIKTAEALQIKGLTADGNGSADNETSETHDKPQQRHVEEYKPMPRPKKQPAPAVAPSPPVKRSRLSSDSQSTGSVAATPITKQEPSASASIGFSNVVQPEQVHFKMEPSDQSGGMLDETGDETFGDDGLGGVGESEGGEPQAGTSGADGTGEGQGRKKRTVYMRCSMAQKLDCKARAIQRLDSGHVFTTKDHNHPADIDEGDILEFLDQLKQACHSGDNMSLKDIYAQKWDLQLSVWSQIEKLRKHEVINVKMEKTSPINIRTEDLLQKIKGKPDMPRYIVNGFVFHVNITKGNPRMIYLRCLEYKRLGCHARAVIPYDGSVQDIKVNKPHNHPPDHAAEEKIVFLRELKEVTFKNPSVPSRTIYTTLAEV